MLRVLESVGLAEIVALIGTLSTASIAAIAWVKLRAERDKLRAEGDKIREDAKESAVNASRGAVGVMSETMARMELEMDRMRAGQDDMGRRLTLTDERLAAVTTRHDVAIVHIADREAFTVSFHPTRPDALPPVPEILVPEVLRHRPELPLRRDDVADEPDGEILDEVE
ncbi:membrane protein [Corynebacterium phage Stiles]|uniref:Uncharacterized protein n=1 Tax=Corynebacterium phage Stiles TaxID=2588504 RepID=A0A4Y6EPG4_9CAUD|nr:membrane protein [Corynebacterium phage Stiles]QDF20035.1 hypothetical protein SEA_STILES_23 [Corynebacterium phage Stiles]